MNDEKDIDYLAMVRRGACSLADVPKKLRTKEFVLAAAQQGGWGLEYAGDLLADRDVISRPLPKRATLPPLDGVRRGRRAEPGGFPLLVGQLALDEAQRAGCGAG